MVRILENLEAIRKERGVKQEVIANKLGVSQATYSGYLRDTGDMMISRLQEIADIIGVSLVDIVTYPEKYVPVSDVTVECDECRKKQETIDNLNFLIRQLKKKNCV